MSLLFAPTKDSMLHCIALSTGTYERGTFTAMVKRYQGTENVRVVEFLLHLEIKQQITLNSMIVVEFLLHLEIKQQIMLNNVKTQHKHMFL